jgi:hypothetical protein
MTRTTCKFRCSLHGRPLEGKPGFYVRNSAESAFGLDLHALSCPEHARWDVSASTSCQAYWVVNVDVDDDNVSLGLVLSARILATTIEPNTTN